MLRLIVTFCARLCAEALFKLEAFNSCEQCAGSRGPAVGPTRARLGLGLGYVWVGSVGPAGPIEEAAASTVRILAHRWRFVHPDAGGRAQAPSYVARTSRGVAPTVGRTTNELRGEVESVLGGALNQWLATKAPWESPGPPAGVEPATY